MERRHILLCGPRGAGKSTLAARLLRETSLAPGGFVTRSTPPDENGFHAIYIHAASDPRRETTEENHIGSCNGRERTVYSAVFDTRGAALLRQGGALLLMDELGFMEADSPVFCAEALRALDGDTPVLACVRAVFDLPFLRAVLSHPRAAVYHVTPENRDALYERLRPVAAGWGRDAAGKK